MINLVKTVLVIVAIKLTTWGIAQVNMPESNHHAAIEQAVSTATR